MKVLSIISRDLEKGSTKFRIAQYVDFLLANGISIEFAKRKEITASFFKRLPEFDLVFNQKCLLSSLLSKKIFMNAQKTIFDFDDAIYTRPGTPHSFITRFRVRKRFHLWLKNADTVTTSNEYLAQKAQRYSSSVVIVPMAVNTDIWKPADRKDENQIVIGWAGSPVNIPNIERLDAILSTLLKRISFLKLAVFSGKKPRLSCTFEYHPYCPGDEPSFIKSLDIGLLPLPEEEFTRGKSPVKAIQYLACGIPVVGNIFGATQEILNTSNSIAVTNNEQWINALETLIYNRDLRRELGQEGRQLVLKKHNMNTVREQVLGLFLNRTGNLTMEEESIRTSIIG